MTPDKESTYQPRYWGTLDEYISQVRPRARRINLLATQLCRNAYLGKARDPRKKAYSHPACHLPVEQGFESGLLEQIGPRRYKQWLTPGLVFKEGE